MPEQIEKLPDDPFADAPLHYQRSESGCVVYSVGPKQKDDHGMNADSDENESSPLHQEREADDLCLRFLPQ